MEGLRVIDFTRVLAGPFATQTLADLGADVIKVEHPTAPDQFRFRKPVVGGESSPFLSLNRNKRSITLDLANPAGHELAMELIRASDVLVENYTTRVMRNYKLDYDSLAPLCPRLIYCSVSAYGRTGSMANAPGYDPVVAAETGVAWLGATDDSAPNLGGIPAIDITTAQNAATAILAAVIARGRTGQGQFVEVSLFDSAIQNLSYLGYHYLVSGQETQRFGRYVALGGPAGYFDTEDGMIMIIASSDRDFRTACNIIGAPAMAEDERYATFHGRFTHMAEINAEFTKRLRTGRRDHWVRQFREHNIPAAPYLSVSEALTSPLTQERGMVSTVEHPTAGTIPNITQAIRMSGTPPVPPVAAPTLGQHNEDILHTVLGYDENQIKHFASAGAFGAPK